MADYGTDEFDALIRLLRATSAEAVPAAENAAAVVYKNAIASAAPVESGQLRASIKVVEGRPGKNLLGDNRQRLFVGPEKRKGYYGYFVEKGHRTAGSKRVGRKATTKTHGQRGVGSTGFVRPYPWFDSAARSADNAAEQAAEAAFNAKLEELNNKG